MKIYISADIEGISGVVSGSQTGFSGDDYQRARKLMTEEVNAAIEGAVEAGATEILVNDSHGSMRNIIIEDLNTNATLISGTPKMLGMMEGIDSTFDAAMFIGYHGRMNTKSVLSHTYHGRIISNININGKDAGEFYINASVAGFFHVPVVLVSGDDILSEEVTDVNDKIETAIVKKSKGRYAAECITPKVVHSMIKGKAKLALSKSICLTEINGPVEIRITFINSGFAQAASLMPYTQLSSPNVVIYKASNISEGYRAIMAMVKIAASTL